MTENKRFKWEDVYKWEVPAFLEVMNGLHEKNEQLKKENENLNNVLEDFMIITNRLQSEPNNKSLQGMARDMLQMMGKNIMGDSDD